MFSKIKLPFFTRIKMLSLIFIKNNSLLNFFYFYFIKSTNYIIYYFSNNFQKKYLFTINHKKLGLHYFYFSLITALCGSYLATTIRLEMSYYGSSFFDGDSLKYLQVISAHALIMIFFVVVPIFFGGFANFLLPYHIGSKDVAYPRLNNLGFWIQPCGFLLIAKMGSLRLDYWTVETKTVFYTNMSKFTAIHDSYSFNQLLKQVYYSVYNHDLFILLNFIKDKKFIEGKNPKTKRGLYNLDDINYKIIFWNDFYESAENLWSFIKQSDSPKRRKRYLVKCSNAPQTVAGWTFITPFSSNTDYTGFGLQDMLILGVYFVGISTTISIINLLVTRRTLSMSGLKNRRILLSFITITILLMLRALSVITPVLGSAMLMLLTDRHWKTSFFDYAYGGDAIFFQHLFWFFGHPEVYVLIIPAFGVINAVLTSSSHRRVASKHHLIWAIYIMNYMGFIVWGHHMYLIGLDHRSRSLYSTVTIMISLPATIKVVNWSYTLVNGFIKNDLILHSVISFILFFLVAGFTGMWLSHVSLNISMHDTLYVVAHFHLMLAGAVMMGIFIGFYFYYNSILLVKYSKTMSLLHIYYYSGGIWFTFLPLFWVAFSGLPRRLHDFPAMYIGWQACATAGHFMTMLGVFAFYIGLFETTYEKKTSINLVHIISRFNKNSNYFYFKRLNNKINKFI